MPKYIKRFYKNYMKTRPIKFYLSLSILLLLLLGVYYIFKSLEIKLLFNTYISKDLNYNFEEVFFINKTNLFYSERNIPLINSIFFFKLSSFYLMHIYFFFKICIFLHLFFTLYSVLFDYFRDYMSISFFLLNGAILYFIFFYSLDFLNLSLFSKDYSLDILYKDLNLILEGKEALENCNKISFNLVKLWLNLFFDVIYLKFKSLGDLSWHSELF